MSWVHSFVFSPASPEFRGSLSFLPRSSWGKTPSSLARQRFSQCSEWEKKYLLMTKHKMIYMWNGPHSSCVWTIGPGVGVGHGAVLEDSGRFLGTLCPVHHHLISFILVPSVGPLPAPHQPFYLPGHLFSHSHSSVLQHHILLQFLPHSALSLQENILSQNSLHFL